MLNEHQLWEPADMMRAARSILTANQQTQAQIELPHTGGNFICVTARTNQDCVQYETALKAAGHEVFRITGTKHDIADQNPIRIATMHRIKGLEFDHVCLAGLQKRDLSAMGEEREQSEKCLIHVADLQAAELARSGMCAAVLPDLALASLDARRFHRLPLPERHPLCLAWSARNADTRPALARLIGSLGEVMALAE